MYMINGGGNYLLTFASTSWRAQHGLPILSTSHNDRDAAVIAPPCWNHSNSIRTVLSHGVRPPSNKERWLHRYGLIL